MGGVQDHACKNARRVWCERVTEKREQQRQHCERRVLATMYWYFTHVQREPRGAESLQFGRRRRRGRTRKTLCCPLCQLAKQGQESQVRRGRNPRVEGVDVHLTLTKQSSAGCPVHPAEGAARQHKAAEVPQRQRRRRGVRARVRCPGDAHSRTRNTAPGRVRSRLRAHSGGGGSTGGRVAGAAAGTASQGRDASAGASASRHREQGRTRTRTQTGRPSSLGAPAGGSTDGARADTSAGARRARIPMSRRASARCWSWSWA